MLKKLIRFFSQTYGYKVHALESLADASGIEYANLMVMQYMDDKKIVLEYRMGESSQSHFLTVSDVKRTIISFSKIFDDYSALKIEDWR